MVTVGLDELIVGRAIDFPIHDSHGVLLLAEGMVITSDFKRKLGVRGLNEIALNAEDAQRVTLGHDYVEVDCSPFTFDNELTQRFDSVIESGDLAVVNTGAALRDSRVYHGRKAYDPENRERLLKQHLESTKSLDGMMKTVVRGKGPNVNELNCVVASYLAEMHGDSDSVLTVAGEVSREQSLSDHCLQMSILGMALGVECGLDAGNVKNIGLVGMVHDWAMLRVPAPIRHAPRALTQTEMLEVQKHPIYALEFLERLSGLPPIVPLVSYQIHERPNGSGYPRGRSGNSIHQFSRILAVADAYLGLTSKRPYRKAFMPYAAMETLLKMSATKLLDAAIVRHLVNLLSLFPIGSFVALTDGSIARVLRRNGDKYTSPIVQRVQDARGRRVSANDPQDIIDLSASQLKVQQALPTPGKDEIGSR